MEGGLDNLVTARSLKHFGISLEGVALQAADIDWKFGQGNTIEGAAADLVLVLAGRSAGAEHLSGPGVGGLRDRLVVGR